MAGSVFPMARVEAQGPERAYVVQLKSEQDRGKLLSLDAGAEKRFGFSESDQFRNIYTFHSNHGLLTLKQELEGSYLYLEPEQQVQTHVVTTNDRGFTTNPYDIDKTWGLPKTGFTEAWEKTTGSTKNVVAVVDTGIDATHEDLAFINFVKGFNFLTNQEILPYTNSDDNGHGTLIAGVLGATANNGRGVVGTNWSISIMPLKALDSSGTGNSPTIAEAIVWAADSGATILNLSLGGVGFGHDTTLANAISYAFNKDVVIVSAAGNDVAVTGGDLDIDPVFPICDDNDQNMIIGVAAVDQNDVKPEFSNFGKNCIDVTAPGKRILSTINVDPFTKKPAPNSYAYASGTSMAVPFVAGQAALIRALYPYATNAQVRDRIISSADPIDQLNLSQCAGRSCVGMLGAGRINVSRSLQKPIANTAVQENDLVQVTSDGVNKIYFISGGQKRLVSPFVLNQRFAGVQPRTVSETQLKDFQEGPYAAPLDGTLVKLDREPTVYVISKGVKLGVTGQVFLQRGLKFTDIKVVSYPEFTSWVTGSLLPPSEGTLIRAQKSKTVYWVVGEVLHPMNFAFFQEKGLKRFSILTVPDKDITNFPKGEAYIK